MTVTAMRKQQAADFTGGSCQNSSTTYRKKGRSAMFPAAAIHNNTRGTSVSIRAIDESGIQEKLCVGLPPYYDGRHQ